MNKSMTRRELQERYPHVIEVGYCNAQYLLNGLNRIGYNSGLYGWNWSAYDLGQGVAICTGYRNLCGDRSVRSYQLVRAYDLKARRLYEEGHSELIPQLRESFISAYLAG